MTKITLKDIKNLGKGEIISYTEDEALAAVKKDGNALRYVREQTHEICLAAVERNEYALKYVKEQTPEICLAAVKENRDALRYVDPSVFQDEEETITVNGKKYKLVKDND